MCQVKISNFHFGDISSFSPPYLNESFIAISQKIENFFLYRTVYKDIFLIIPQTTNSPYTGRKIEPNNSISIKRLSGKVKAIFLTLDSERASKTESNGIYNILITH